MRCLVLGLATVLFAASSLAHPPPRGTQREIVRLTGNKVDGEPAGSSLVLVVLGREYRFAPGEFRVFGFEDLEQGPPRGGRFVLQGPRDVLQRFAAARADQRVSVLAERRTAGGDLFVLALDLCPEQ